MNTKNVYLLLKIVVLIGWITFFIYNIAIVRQLGQDYNNNPADFVFFDDEQHRTAYKESITPNIYRNLWIDEASLVTDCKPMIYVNNFYMNKIDPLIKGVLVLIIMTIFISIPFGDWRETKKKIDKFADKFKEDEDGNNRSVE